MSLLPDEPPPRLSPLRADLSPAWQALIDRVMAKTPAERPASANQFINQLKKLAEPALGIGTEGVCPKDGMVQLYVPAQPLTDFFAQVYIPDSDHESAVKRESLISRQKFVSAVAS